MREVLDLGARELARRIAARDLAPEDLMRATLDRIEEVNPDLTAIVALRDREALMGEARLAGAMAPAGPLHGLPVAVKDLVAVRGVAFTEGSAIHAGRVAEADDALAARLRAAGAIVIGKTNVPAFGLGSHSKNAVFGVTRNPYDTALSAGGSSGGAAAALAARMLPLADGSDMMGSLRNPAAWNNVYGFRPTPGLVPGEVGERVLTHRLSTAGPMARSLEDLETLLEVMSGGGVRAGSGKAPGAPRIGWLGDWGGAYPMEPGILDLAESALAAMEGLGWNVEPVASPFPARALWDSWTTLRSFALALELGHHWRDEDHRARLTAPAEYEISHGFALRGAEIEWAAGVRVGWRAALADLFARFDALVLPSTQCWPFPAERDWPVEVGGRAMDTYHRWMEVTIPASLAGCPVLNLPAGFGAAGLPGGVQLIGPWEGDARLLAMGRGWHRATDWPASRPPPL